MNESIESELASPGDARATVLLVDDDPAILRGLERHLRRDGFQILSAVSAEEASAILRKHKIGAVVSDHRMVGASGTAFLADVKRTDPDVVRIMLSGQISRHDEWRLINQVGVFRLFRKPCSALMLAEALKQTLGHGPETGRSEVDNPKSGGGEQ